MFLNSEIDDFSPSVKPDVVVLGCLRILKAVYCVDIIFTYNEQTMVFHRFGLFEHADALQVTLMCLSLQQICIYIISPFLFLFISFERNSLLLCIQTASLSIPFLHNFRHRLALFQLLLPQTYCLVILKLFIPR